MNLETSMMEQILCIATVFLKLYKITTQNFLSFVDFLFCQDAELIQIKVAIGLDVNF